MICDLQFSKAVALAVLLLCTFLVVCANEAYDNGDGAGNESFHENLRVEGMADGRIHVSFRFGMYKVSTLTVHHNIFPKSISDLMQGNDVAELHVHLTQGRWRYPEWGNPEESSPQGGEVWAWFDQQQADVDGSWKGVTASLSGILCASFNFITAVNTAAPCFMLGPSQAYGPRQDFEDCMRGNVSLRYGVLPGEAVCTENLTPWTQLLPCRDANGLAQLLTGIKMFGADYASLGLVAEKHPENANSNVIEQTLIMTASVVFNTPQNKVINLVSDLFGRKSFHACPVATSSVFYMPKAWDTPTFRPRAPPEFTAASDGHWRAYDLKAMLEDIQPRKKDDHFIKSVGLPANRPAVLNGRSKSFLYMTRHIEGTALDKGVMAVSIRHTGSHPVTITYFDLVPWVLQVLGHTIKVEVENQPGYQALEYLRFVPSKARISPGVMELVMTLPSQSVTRVTYNYNTMFLRMSEHHPDAHRGIEIGGALAEFYVVDDNSSLHAENYTAEHSKYPLRVYSNTIIVGLPLPDFSMPYNVITLVGTLMALSFGFFFNLTTRNYTLKKQPTVSRLTRLLNTLRGALNMTMSQTPEEEKPKE